MINPYQVLQLPFSASSRDVRAAFRRLAKVYHPDVPDTGDATLFQDLLQAAEELSNDEGRERWRAVYQDGAPRRPHNPFLNLDEEADEMAVDEFDGLINFQTRNEIMQAWAQKKRMRRRQRLRRLLRGRAAGARTADSGVSADIWKVVRRVLSVILEVPVAEVQPEASLTDIGFFTEYFDDVCQIICLLEDTLDIDLATMEEGKYIKFEMPFEVETVGDFAAFVEAKMAEA